MNNIISQSNIQCSICLSKNHRKGKTDGCMHLFCFKCLKKWAKRENTCPVCRESFTQISKVSTQKKNKAKLTHQTQKDKALPLSYEPESDQDSDLVEKNIFSVLLGPETRSNDVKFLELYYMMMGLENGEA